MGKKKVLVFALLCYHVMGCSLGEGFISVSIQHSTQSWHDNLVYIVYLCNLVFKVWGTQYKHTQIQTMNLNITCNLFRASVTETFDLASKRTFKFWPLHFANLRAAHRQTRVSCMKIQTHRTTLFFSTNTSNSSEFLCYFASIGIYLRQDIIW